MEIQFVQKLTPQFADMARLEIPSVFRNVVFVPDSQKRVSIPRTFTLHALSPLTLRTCRRHLLILLSD